MKFSKVLTFSIAGFVALAIVVLTARQVLVTDVAKPYLAIVNANIVGQQQQKIATAMLLKGDRIQLFGTDQEVLQALPEEGVTLDMNGKTIVPGKVMEVQNLAEELLAQGITTAQINAESEQDANEYYWGRQHGWYDVRVQVVNNVELEQTLSDHLFFVGKTHPNSQFVGTLSEGGFADFRVLENGELKQTWLGGVKRYQVQ